MTKPTSGAEQKLISAGLYLAKEKGVSGFSVRQLCSKAKVNPGLFHYYFTSRENFNKAVLKEVYNCLIKDLRIHIAQNLKPKEKLIAFGGLLADFSKNNNSLMASIIMDVVSGNKEIMLFIKENFTYHIKLLLSIIEECKKENALKDADSLSIMFAFILPIVVPNVAVSVLEKILDKKELGKSTYVIKKILSDDAVKERSSLSAKAVLK